VDGQVAPDGVVQFEPDRAHMLPLGVPRPMNAFPVVVCAVPFGAT
jgi:hypothetical protein